MLRLPPFSYHAPRTAAEAARILADLGPDAMAVGGGTDLVPNMKRRQFTPRALVGLRQIEGGVGIRGNGGLTLGALTTLADVAADRTVIDRWPVVARTAGLVAAPLLRTPAHRATGGRHQLQLLQPDRILAGVHATQKRDGTLLVALVENLLGVV